MPANAIESAYYGERNREGATFITTDGKEVRPIFVRTSNTAGGRFKEDYDAYCQEHYGMNFDYLCKIWYGRLGQRPDDYWHIIKFIEI